MLLKTIEEIVKEEIVENFVLFTKILLNLFSFIIQFTLNLKKFKNIFFEQIFIYVIFIDGIVKKFTVFFNISDIHVYKNRFAFFFQQFIISQR